ncbi:hypothetical protein OF83DRAFT_379882 [Amylostereum chailletii]|nr:hypothetical protein OF83DRAFT_379882 [Amylostereum chailletii]
MLGPARMTWISFLVLTYARPGLAGRGASMRGRGRLEVGGSVLGCSMGQDVLKIEELSNAVWPRPTARDYLNAQQKMPTKHPPTMNRPVFKTRCWNSPVSLSHLRTRDRRLDSCERKSFEGVAFFGFDSTNKMLDKMFRRPVHEIWRGGRGSETRLWPRGWRSDHLDSHIQE